MTNPTDAVPGVDALFVNEGFIRAVARGLLGRDDLADDVVQETWLVALEKRPRRPGALRAWLGGIARNLSLRARRRGAMRGRVARDRPAPPGEISPETIAMREEARRRVVQALLTLDEIYRHPLLLRFYEGLSHREVAHRLGVPLETARTRTKRGLARLRERLDRVYGGDRRKWATVLLPLAVGTERALGAVVAAILAVVVVAAGVAWWPGAAGHEPPPPPTERAAVSPAAPAPAPEPSPGPASAAPAAPPAAVPEPAERTVTGVVVDETGKTVGGGRALAFPPEYSPFQSAGPRHTRSQLELTLGRAAESVVADASVADDGSFRIALPREKTFVLVARVAGYASDERPVPPDTRRVRVGVRPAGRLVVVLRGPDGPVTKGWIALERVASPEGVFEQQDLEDGRRDWSDRTFPLEIGPMNPGLFRLTAGADDPGNPGGRLRSRDEVLVPVGAGEVRRVELLLVPRVRSKPAEPKARWSLRLVDLDGEPIDTSWLGTGARAGSLPPAIDAGWPGGRRRFQMSRDGTGSFFAPESVLPRVTGKLGMHDLDQRLPAGGGEQRIVIPLRIREAVRELTGHVVDDAGAPVSDVLVAASGRCQVSRRTKTEADGGFRITGLLPGPWTVTVSSERHEWLMRREVPEDASDLVLAVKRKPEPATLFVRVRLPRIDHEEAKVFIRERESRRTWDWWFRLDPAGEGRQRGLPPGSYRVIARVPTLDGGLVDRAEVTLAAGEEKRLELGGERMRSVVLVAEGADRPRDLDWSVRPADGSWWLVGPTLPAGRRLVLSFPRAATTLSVGALDDGWEGPEPFTEPKGEIVLRWRRK